MSAQGRWDASKHHHGFHGQWASTGVATRTADAEHIQAQRSRDRRSPSAFQPRAKASGRRADKRQLQQSLEVARGVRAPATQKERDAVEWASPSKRAAQRTLTGDVRKPRKEAIAGVASAVRKRGTPTVGTKKTFTGKTRRVRDIVPPHGARTTARGRFNLTRSSG